MKILFYLSLTCLSLLSCKKENQNTSIQNPNIRNSWRKHIDIKRAKIKSHFQNINTHISSETDNIIEFEQQLKDLHHKFPNIKKIEFIDWFQKSAQEISIITKFEKIEVLDLRSKWNKSLPANFENLSNLDSLHLSMSNLLALPSAIGKLKNLRYLSIDCENLKTIEKESLNLPNLITLVINAGHKDFKLNSALDSLPQLKHLTLNNVSILPQSIGSKTLLESLSIKGAIEIPNNIEHLINLKNISLSNCPKISSFDINSFTKLISLSIYNTNTEDINFTNKLKSLKILNLSDLQALPDGIGNLPELEFLNIARTDLTKISSSISNANKLNYIRLHTCRGITDLPTFFKDLPSLIELDLYSNYLKSIPKTIFESKSIKLINYHQEKNLNIPDEYLQSDKIYFTNLMTNNFEYTNGIRKLEFK